MSTRGEILRRHYAGLAKRALAWAGMVSMLSTLFVTTPASAAQITARKVTLSSSSPAASNATTTYTFSFTVPTTGTAIKSWQAQACTTALGTCTTPTNFATPNASTLSSQPTNLGSATGWTINTGTTGVLRIVNAANATNPSGSQTITIGTVQNPTTTGTFFLRMTTYSDSAWTTPIDTGTVAASTATQFAVTADVSESLSFCVGQSYASGCSGSSVTLSPNPLTTASISTGTGVFAASTNGGSGFVVTYLAGQFTNGSANFANNFGTGGSASSPGTEEFGLKATLTSGTGGAVNATYSGTNYAWNPTVTTQIATSGGGPVDTNVFTVTYGANVSPTTPFGTYSTTFNYVCTPTF